MCFLFIFNEIPFKIPCVFFSLCVCARTRGHVHMLFFFVCVCMCAWASVSTYFYFKEIPFKMINCGFCVEGVYLLISVLMKYDLKLYNVILFYFFFFFLCACVCEEMHDCALPLKKKRRLPIQYVLCKDKLVITHLKILTSDNTRDFHQSCQ